MAVEIVKVEGKALLREFITFPEKLYKDCPNFVPALIGDEFDTLDKKKNAAFDYCDADLFLARKDGKTVGRVAAIINHNANKTWNEKTCRFGWMDFTEDLEVVEALIGTVTEWGRKRGCNQLKGPLGFTDMDKEGSLVEGYEHLSPFTCLYNYPYYDRLLKEVGLEKNVDWTQTVVEISPELPPMFQYAPIVEKRFGLSIVNSKFKNMRDLGKKYGMSIFHMYNETFAPLYQFAPLTDKQIKRYLQTYIPILNKDFVPIVVDSEGNPVGFAFCVPSLSKAVKASGGRLFPFGFLRILRALKKNDTIEALMIGVLPEYQGKGANVLIFKMLHENCIKAGITRLILNPELEENFKVQTLFSEYKTEPFMRRRSYTKQI